LKISIYRMGRGEIRYLVLVVIAIVQAFCEPVSAQSPQKFSYQELVRDATNVILLNQTIGMQVSILQGSPVAAAVYSERHTPTTNANGLASIEVGTGSFPSGNFLTISWSSGPYFVKTEIDPAGGTAYSLTNTTQLLSVPYALYAKTLNYNNLSNKPVIDGTETKIISGTTITVGGVGSTATPYVVNFVTHSVTQAERIAIATPYTGQFVWCSNCGPSGELQLYNGTAWINMCGGAAAPVLPSVTTTAVSAITAYTATSGGNVTSDGGGAVTARGVCWSTSVSPTTADSKTADGAGMGSFVSLITGLIPGTTYYVRAFATNSTGTAYGTQQSFTAPLLPSLTTTAASSILVSSAASGGNITSDGGLPVTARGVCWSIYSNPTTADPKTIDGTGIGIFVSSITGLTFSTTIYVRAYATTSAGTAYGNQISFTTPNLAVGDAYQGGIVAYLLKAGDLGYVPGVTDGFIAAPSDHAAGAVQWGCHGTDIGGAATAERTFIGGGLDNTLEIRSNCSEPNRAAYLCIDLVLNGYDDWYLPSRDELGVMYFSRATIGGFAAASYWSSTENGAPLSATYANYIDFNSGFPSGDLKNTTKRVRPIRSFLMIGELWGGGRIAYIFKPGDPGYVPGETHGLIAATADQSAGLQWYNGSNTTTGAIATALGTGAANTTTIVTIQGAGSYAAKLCADYTIGLYSDWHLPSKEELNKIYPNKTAVGGFFNANYWSSSEDTNSQAWAQLFTDGTQSSQTKNNTYRVRAVRTF